MNRMLASSNEGLHGQRRTSTVLSGEYRASASHIEPSGDQRRVVTKTRHDHEKSIAASGALFAVKKNMNPTFSGRNVHENGGIFFDWQ